MRLLMSFAMLALCACSGGSQAPPQPPAAATPPPPTGGAAQVDDPANAAFIGRVWKSTKPGGPLGTILVFLPDRTLLMDSCFETYRVSKWGVAGNHIRWLEDTVPLEAEVVTPSKDELILRMGGQTGEQRYVALTDPYTCPDMPK